MNMKEERVKEGRERRAKEEAEGQLRSPLAAEAEDSRKRRKPPALNVRMLSTSFY